MHAAGKEIEKDGQIIEQDNRITTGDAVIGQADGGNGQNSAQQNYLNLDEEYDAQNPGQEAID